MTEPVTVVLAGEPKPWARARFNGKTGRFFTPSHVRQYQDVLRSRAQDAMGDRAPFAGPVRVEITAAFPIPKSWPKWRVESARSGREWHCSRPDADNVIKNLDCFNEVVFRDDAQIVDAHVTKLYSDHPSLTIIVEPLTVTTRDSAPRPAKARTAEPQLAL